MRTADRPLPFAGTDEELEQYLREFAGATGGWAGKESTTGRWSLSSGARLSSNPNTIPLRIRVTRAPGGLVLDAGGRALPWTRPKVTRIADYRMGQLADYVTARVRGSGPEKFSLLPFREPFTPFGSGVAALTASFSWAVLGAVACWTATLLVLTLGCVPFMSRSIHDITEHSRSLLQAGAVPLPSPAEAAATGPWMPALIFAVPIAFFLALVHSAALAACDLSPRTARLPQASVLFQALLLGIGFFPYFPILSGVLALAVPAAGHLGFTLLWSRRRERIREGPRPPKAVLIIAVALAASLGGAAVPRATAWTGALDRMALFRDAWLLDHPAGKAIARAYYRYTLYTAEPLKELYAVDPGRARKAQPIAHVLEPGLRSPMRALGFTLAPAGEADVTVGGRVEACGVARALPDRPDLAVLKSALADVSRESFRGLRLRELSALGWHALYYAGPLAALLVLMGGLSPFISILFRKLRPQAALFALSACAIVASLSLVLLTSPSPPAADPAALTEDLAERLGDARAAVRHEAAYRASRLDSTAALAEPLLRAADDEDLRVRLWAVAALGKSGDPRAYAKLVERLEDPELFVRYRAAEGLGWLKDRRAVPSLVRTLRERSWYEGSYALDALRRLEPGTF